MRKKKLCPPSEQATAGEAPAGVPQVPPVQGKNGRGREGDVSPAKKRPSRKRKLNMVVRVVPPGTLRPNPRNEFARLTPQERREGMLKALASALAAAERKLAAEARQRAAQHQDEGGRR